MTDYRQTLLDVRSQLTNTISFIDASMSEKAMDSADGFVARISLNTHLTWRKTIWGQQPAWRDLFKQTGVRFTRSTLGTIKPAYDDLKYIGAQCIMVIGTEPDKVAAQAAIDRAAQDADWIKAVESLNEFNHNHPANWVANLKDFQKWLFAAVNAKTALKDKPVLGPSVWGRLKADYEA